MDSITLAAVGDVFVDRADPTTALAGIRSVLDAADVTFGNYEGVLTDDSPVVPGASFAALTATSNAAATAGFDVMSLANNHAMDAGWVGLQDTVRALDEQGVRTVGAGEDLGRALSPVTIERGSLRLAVLAVTAVLQHGAEARPGLPGVAPLRADDCYLPPYASVSCPGVAPRIVSVLNEADWLGLAEAIGRAKAAGRLVAVSVHWGDHTRPWVLTDHERLCAQLIAEAGADVVLGHHQHMLRGMDHVGGVPVWYGLGHAVFDQARLAEEYAAHGFDMSTRTPAQMEAMFGEYGIFPRPGQPAFPFHPMARRTAVAVVELGADGVRRCGAVPCLIDGEGVARPVSPGSAHWAELTGFLSECQTRAGLSSQVVADTDWRLGGHPVVEFKASE